MAVLNKKIEILQKRIDNIKRIWTSGYHNYNKNVAEMRQAKNTNSKNWQRLCKLTEKWQKERTAQLTMRRKKAEAEQHRYMLELTELDLKKENLLGQIKAEQAEDNEIVETIFARTEEYLDALESRNAYVTRHVFPRMIIEDGELLSRVTIENEDETRRVVAKVRYLKIVDQELATKGIAAIDRFFSRVRPVADLDPDTQLLYEIAQQVVHIKITPSSIEIGEKMGQFLRLNIKKTKHPDLWQAQDFLKRSISSKKSPQYILLFERVSNKDPWKAFKQTL